MKEIPTSFSPLLRPDCKSDNMSIDDRIIDKQLEKEENANQIVNKDILK